MPSLRTETLNKAQVEIVPADRIVTAEYKLRTFDMYTCDTNSTNFKSEFKLNIIKTCKLTGIVGYFDSVFDNNKPVTLSTAPHSPPTHWKQTVFLLPDPIDVIEGNFYPKPTKIMSYQCFLKVSIQKGSFKKNENRTILLIIKICSLNNLMLVPFQYYYLLLYNHISCLTKLVCDRENPDICIHSFHTIYVDNNFNSEIAELGIYFNIFYYKKIIDYLIWYYFTLKTMILCWQKSNCIIALKKLSKLSIQI